MALQLVNATVKFPAGKVFQGEWGDRVNFVAVSDSGEEIKIWGNADNSEIKELKKGQKVQLVWDGKGYKLVNSEPAPAEKNSHQNNGNQSPKPELSVEQKRAIAAYIQGQADLFNFCLKTVRERVEGINPDDTESLRAIATTLYISAQRKFNL